MRIETDHNTDTSDAWCELHGHSEDEFTSEQIFDCIKRYIDENRLTVEHIQNQLTLANRKIMELEK